MIFSSITSAADRWLIANRLAAWLQITTDYEVVDLLKRITLELDGNDLEKFAKPEFHEFIDLWNDS